MVIPESCSESRPHADVHAAVSADHHKSDGLIRQFSPSSTLLKRLHNTGQSCGTVLEQIVDIWYTKGCLRIRGGDHHAASCLEQQNYVSLYSF